jgi:catechol 2,3-dioxygenase-like lactoylglutathione lyase family enzyme
VSTASHFIFYVADQERSTAFYAQALGMAPRLHMPGYDQPSLDCQQAA